MTDEFDGKVALVTGAGSGIGEACAVLLAERGARVVVADLREDAAERVARGIGAAALAVGVDVSDLASCAAMVGAAVDRFGRLDVAVNNAGIAGAQAPVAEYPVESWHQVISVHLDGTFYCMRAELPALLADGGGSIVNMASILGSVGFAQASAYVAAKHGIVGLTRAAALEYGGQGVRVNAVGPGFIDTPLLAALPAEQKAGLASLHPRGRLGSSDEVAELVAFLASDRAANTTGAYYTTDGGYTAQ